MVGFGGERSGSRLEGWRGWNGTGGSHAIIIGKESSAIPVSPPMAEDPEPLKVTGCRENRLNRSGNARGLPACHGFSFRTPLWCPQGAPTIRGEVQLLWGVASLLRTDCILALHWWHYWGEYPETIPMPINLWRHGLDCARAFL